MISVGGKLLALAIAGALFTGIGSAYAAATITGADIVDGTIQSVDIGSRQVANVDLATDAVDGAKIKNLSIRNGDLGNDIVTSGKIKDGTIATMDLGNGIVTGQKIQGITKLMFLEMTTTHTLGPQEMATFGQGISGLEFGDNVIATANPECSGCELVLVNASVQDEEGPALEITAKNDGTTSISDVDVQYSIIVYSIG